MARSTSTATFAASSSGGIEGSASTPGQRRISLTDSGAAAGTARSTWLAASASCATRAASTARSAAPGEVRFIADPAFDLAALLIRRPAARAVAGSRWRNSSGSLTVTSRYRWLTERSSTDERHARQFGGLRCEAGHAEDHLGFPGPPRNVRFRRRFGTFSAPRTRICRHFCGSRRRFLYFGCRVAENVSVIRRLAQAEGWRAGMRIAPVYGRTLGSSRFGPTQTDANARFREMT